MRSSGTLNIGLERTPSDDFSHEQQFVDGRQVRVDVREIRELLKLLSPLPPAELRGPCDQPKQTVLTGCSGYFECHNTAPWPFDAETASDREGAVTACKVSRTFEEQA